MKLSTRARYGARLMIFLARHYGQGSVFLREIAQEEDISAVSYTHLRAHETVLDLVCRLLLEKKKIYARRIPTHSSFICVND